ncbi:MAG: type I-E CRISPR-associated protein Cse2/CasB [Elusimicrobiales bacterium]|jgi:CRISPR system Cascade subunit CasB|nr:type I-E CRISPR-associated protein Cse2/CasB [Elusimicrobiales bacterium]HOL62276.1 type I-E CRISPR-associated protein Cse2/CasB [Elusimicrobiales bacterium]HPO95034.1 type I-E CRISPR-associated protein Cse2/CasB [Elusimicrobiales bacterium]
MENEKIKNFINFVINRSQKDSAFRAAFKKADNPNTEHEAWEYLCNFGFDIENDYERKPLLLIGSAIAKSKITKDGNLTLGKAIAKAYDNDKNKEGPAKTRLRRLLACQNIDEVCSVLRHILSLISSKQVPLSYYDLLNDILFWNYQDKIERIKIKWAKDFYSKGGEDVCDSMENRD